MGFSSNLVRSCLLLVLLALLSIARAKIFNVMDYGAVGDGTTDSTVAFQTAWNEICASNEDSIQMLVPEGTFLVGALKFNGPCKSALVFQLNGTMLGSSDLSVYDTPEWILFEHIDGLLVAGSGKVDGQGALAWQKDNPHTNLPASIKFVSVTNSKVQDITSVDSKKFHMHVHQCQDLTFQGITISAPSDSPNTDGIHLSSSSNIEISNSVIGTGDDCVSIGPGTKNTNISQVFCGPGHGISVGSLGKNNDEEDVVGLNVTNCTLTDTQNGVRIKTWQNSPAETMASDFTFDDIIMNNAGNPIIIDQKYCPNGECSSQGSPSKVKISNIKFHNIRGDSKTQVAINLICSDAFPCQDIELQDINLTYDGNGGGEATTSCENVQGSSVGTVIPQSCV